MEIKGRRQEDAKEKKLTMETYWIPGVNNLGSYGRWAFAEFREVFEMQHDFAQKLEEEFQQDDKRYNSTGEIKTNMARSTKSRNKKKVEIFIHEDASRKNIPTAEYEAILQEEDKDPIRVAYKRRNRDIDPQLVWRGKDGGDWSDLVVHAMPLYIQEKVHPKALIDDIRRHTERAEVQAGERIRDLFADFNGLPNEAARTEFYQHDANWSNRMILGDSLQGNGVTGRT